MLFKQAFKIKEKRLQEKCYLIQYIDKKENCHERIDSYL
jgi:hypothetical protein